MQQNLTLYTSIFKKEMSKYEVDSNLQNVCIEYPYFTVGQFFNLLQTPTKTTAYTTQLHKTALLFNNNFWLQYQLSQPIVNHNLADNKEYVSATTLNNIENKIPTIPLIQPIAENIIAPIEVQSKTEKSTPQIIPTANESEWIEADEEVLVDEHEDEHESMELNNNVKQVIENVSAFVPNKNELENSTHTIDENNDSDVTPLFEPLHTTDYFASVGIKITDENKPNDKLGKQLKSFTAWLKTMKKIHVSDDSNTATASDINIQILADASNIEANVVTEAMANILIQQGSIKKAIEVFEKLSLLNPAKTAYFAAQINQLKES